MPATHDAQLLVDIDLAILGASKSRYDQYEKQVRFEYQWVDEVLYRHKRAQLLEQFLSRPTLYLTEAFQARFEDIARANLKQAIVTLRNEAALSKEPTPKSTNRSSFYQTPLLRRFLQREILRNHSAVAGTATTSDILGRPRLLSVSVGVKCRSR